MIGDRSWLAELGYGYDQHVADSLKADRECLAFPTWAVYRTWPRFVGLARVCRMLPPFVWSEWETRNPVPGANGNGYHSVVLARRLVDGLVLVNALLVDLKHSSRKAHAAVRAYLDDGRVRPEQRPALTQGKRLVYEWLRRAAERDGATLLDRRVSP